MSRFMQTAIIITAVLIVIGRRNRLAGPTRSTAGDELAC
jgi:hypothetical protein